jgi:hypothetical protein
MQTLVNKGEIDGRYRYLTKPWGWRGPPLRCAPISDLDAPPEAQTGGTAACKQMV